MSYSEELFHVCVKNTFLNTNDGSMRTDPRRCASEPPRHRHHDREAELTKPLAYGDCTSDVSGSTGCDSPRGSWADDSVSDGGSYVGSECGETSTQLGLDQSKDNFSDRISIFDALQTSLQHTEVVQPKRDFIMTSGQSVFGHEVGTTCSGDFHTRDQKHTETSQNVGRVKEYEKSASKGRNGNAAPRTLMICNLPCRLNYDDLIGAINSVGFGDAYEFVHLACRYKQPESNLGYAFVNFFSPADASRFACVFEGYHFSQKGSTKACSVKVAKSQGFNGSYRRMQRSLRLARSQ